MRLSRRGYEVMTALLGSLADGLLEALTAAERLAREGIGAAVVSAPCFELFREQPADYRQAVLGAAPRVGVEAAVEGLWPRWLGPDGAFIGMTGFGASAPAELLYQKFGITPDAVAQAARDVLAKA